MTNQLIVLFAVTMISLLVNQVRASKTVAREARRLRIALTTELTQLLSLQQRNLSALRDGKPAVISSRACTLVFRGSIGRLVSIPDYAIEEVVNAYAVSEQLEHLIAARMKANGPMAYRVIENETPVDELIVEIGIAMAAIEQAIARMRSAVRLGSAPEIIPGNLLNG